jgi:HEAT repeats
MDRRTNCFVWSALGLASCLCAPVAHSQTVERDTTVTGPRGRSINRQVEVQRGPGTINRQVQITRPGGTIDRQVQLNRTAVGGPWRPGWAPGPWARAPWLPRPPLLVAPAVPAFGLGVLAAPSFNFGFGGGGGGVGGGMGMGGPGMGGPGMGGPGGPPGGPMPGGPPGGPPGQPPDQVALEAQRLQSFHANTRKDAAYKLGRFEDPRAVPSLIHVLKYDSWKDVRIAAAIALGEIGGSDAAVALERCAIYDKKDEVKKAATNALERLNAKAKANGSAPTAARPLPTPPPPNAQTSSPFAGYPTQSGEPAKEAPEAKSGSEPAQGTLTPPPPPSPVTPGSGGASNP